VAEAEAAAAAGELKSAPAGEDWASLTLGVAKSAEKGVKGAAGGAGLPGMSRSHPAISSPAAHT